MSTAKRIAKNAGITFIGSNLLRILTAFLVVLIARYLGDVEYGKFTFALSFTGLFFILTDLGTRILIVRDIAQNKKEAPKIVANVLMLKFISSLIVYFLILLMAHSLNYSKETIIAVAIAAFGLMFDSFSTTVSSIFQAYERLEFPAFARIIRIVVRFAFTIPLLIKGSSFLAVLAVYAGVNLLDFIISLIICYSKFVNLNFEFDRKLIASLLKRSFPFLLSGIFVTIYFRVDVTLMSKLAPTFLEGVYGNVEREAVIGWYSAAYNLLDAVTSLPIALSASVLPVAIVYFKEPRETLSDLFSISTKFLTYLSIPIAVGISILSSKIVLFLYGTRYSNASLALSILIWTLVPLCINYMMGAAMIALHEEKKGVIVLFLNVVVNVLLNLYLIPKYSLYGAAIATVLTEIFYFAGYYYIMSKYLEGLSIWKILIKPAIASIAMGAVVYYFLYLNLFVLIFIGAIVYTFAIFALKAINQDDINLIKKVLIRNY